VWVLVERWQQVLGQIVPVVVVELAEGEAGAVVVEGFCCMVGEGLAVVGEQEVVALPSAVKRHKGPGDMVWVLARMPVDFYQYDDTREKRSSQKEGNGNLHTVFLRSRKM